MKLKKTTEIISVLCLIFVLIFALSACGTKESGANEAASAVSPAKPVNSVISVSESDIISYLDESTGMWEFAQRLLDDTIIYKTKFGTWTSVAVNSSLPLNSYDWSKLRHAGVISGTEWEYYEGTDLKSIKGIDLSVYNQVDDWSAVKADGVKFAMLRCGYRGYSTAVIKQDDKFLDFAKSASDAGIDLGVYFVTQAVTKEEAKEEALWVLDKIKESGVDFKYPIVLDLEDAVGDNARTDSLSSSERTDIIIAFCDEIEAAGYKPMLYAATRWYVEEMDLTRLTAYDKWFAQYFNKPFFPYEFQMWQYTGSGNVDGITGVVDLNLCMFDYANN